MVRSTSQLGPGFMITADEYAQQLLADAMRLRSPTVKADVLGPLLTADEVANLLSLSKRTIRRWVQHGRFPAPFRLGRLPRWRTEDLTGWLSRLRPDGPDSVGPCGRSPG
jgi:excisionase family DNA binding protein